jgi:hypothetical protein
MPHEYNVYYIIEHKLLLISFFPRTGLYVHQWMIVFYIKSVFSWFDTIHVYCVIFLYYNN